MISRDGNQYKLEGPVTVHTARAVMEEGQTLFDSGEIVVDLAGVSEVDSSAVSIMLEWMRRAAGNGQTMRFINLPGNLCNLASLYGVLDLIPHA
jgi:phospholipid transport system transporter-binding protein